MAFRRWLGGFTGVALGVSLVAASGASAAMNYAPYHSPPTYGGTFHIAFQTDIPELDPLTWTDAQSMYPMQEIYDTLVAYNPNSAQIVPSIASHWTVTGGGKIYTFFLRKGVKFSNGDSLTAADVQFSLERLTSHANASVSGYGSYYQMIQGFKPWNGGTKGVTGLSGIKVVNPYEIQFTLNYPAAYFFNDLALQAADITDPAVVTKWGNKNYSQHAIGSGPFMLQQWTRNQQMILVRNPLYWGPKPYLKQIDIQIGPDSNLELQLFQKGLIDETVDSELTSSQYLNVLSNPALRADYHRTPENGIVFMYLNTKKGPTANLLVRQAMNYAINKPQLIRTLTNGRGTIMSNAEMPPAMPGYVKGLPQLYPYNLAKAKALMKKAGYAKGFSITFVGYTSDLTTALADYLQAQLKPLNINMNIRIMTYPQYLGVVTNPSKYGIAQYTWYQDYPDPQDFFDALASQAAFGATNFSYYSNAKLQQLITTADQLPAAQDAQRYKLYDQAQQIIAKNAPYLWEYDLWNDEVVQPWVGPNNVNAWGMGPVYEIEFQHVWIGKH